jgi:hypothetical protein
MISVIICSRNVRISKTLEENIKRTIGIDYEIITIDNSKNEYSIFSAYNYGFSISKYPYLCFVHEDVLFKTQNWGQLLIAHLNNPGCGIVGVAGGKVITIVPAQWSNEKSYIHIIQHKKATRTPIYLKEPSNSSSIRESAIVVDGVFLSMQKAIFQKIKFDEKLEGFHGYDYDISIQSVAAGYTNFVVYDILLEHYSAGFKDLTYYNALIKVYKKWIEHLPLYTNDIKTRTEKEIHLIEKKRLKKLIRRMSKVGFSADDIVSNTAYFIDKLKLNGVDVKIKFLKPSVYIIKLFIYIRNRFR